MQDKIIIHQPNLIDDLEAYFEDEVKNKRVLKTPGMPKFKIFCSENDEDIIELNLQS
jgi:hypothetical protein